MVLKKTPILVLLSLLIFACSSEGLSLNGNTKSVINGGPLSNVKVYIFKKKSSIYGMFRYPMVDSSITNNKGIFKFKIKGQGKYVFDFYEDRILQHHSEAIEIKEPKDSLKLEFSW
ncbi:hypothetical protein ACOKFD_16920 [Flagellimonas sp. S174]|uniref:hypothetical protein n=1 Tax=Flagellimonas sp. S174 TaxID=3410790 RepID=UPI003BF5E0AC